MKQNRYRKIIGISICFLFTLQILFAPVWAYDEPTPKTDYSDAVEIIELRDQYTRHYKLEDETFIAVAYPEPVNYLKDGVWEEIDNTLQLVEDDNLEPVYQNKENSYRVTFPQTLNDDNQISIEKDGYEISWQIASANRTLSSGLGELVSDTVVTDKTTNDDDIFVTSKSDSRFIYKSLFDDVDLLYTVKPEAVKEDIILYRAIEDISFTFNVNVNGLTAKKNDDNSISFFSANNEVVFVIQSPYMTDSAEESALSADIALNLTETESGYSIDLILDSDWIMSPDRVFPIYIDPTVSSSQEQTDIVDTFVHYGDAAGDHRLADRLVVGTKSGELCRSFIQTLIPSIPYGSTVTDARLNLSITYGTSTMQNLDVYRVNSTWSSSTMTWAIQNTISKTLVKSNVSSTAYSNYPSSYRYSCDVTNTIIDIYNGIRTNYGFMVKYSNESIADYNRVYSSDYSTSTVRPILTVYYTLEYPTSRTLSLQCVCDETFATDYPMYSVQMNSVIDTIEYPFKERYNLDFNQATFLYKTEFPADDCSLSNHLNCVNATCGSICSNTSYLGPPLQYQHHKNGYYAFSHSTSYSLGFNDFQVLFLGHMLCGNNGSGDHFNGLLGLAYVDGQYCMARNINTSNILNYRILQHEISHLFGMTDDACDGTQPCIAHGGFDDITNLNNRDIWCDHHESQFDRNEIF